MATPSWSLVTRLCFAVRLRPTALVERRLANSEGTISSTAMAMVTTALDTQARQLRSPLVPRRPVYPTLLLCIQCLTHRTSSHITRRRHRIHLVVCSPTR